MARKRILRIFVISSLSIMLFLTVLVRSYAYFSSLREDMFNASVKLDLLFDKLNETGLAKYQETFETPAPSSDEAWGSKYNPYVISNTKHLQNLSILQNKGYFEDKFYKDASGAFDPENIPYFVVSTRDYDTVIINGREITYFEPIGSEEYPFVGSFSGVTGTSVSVASGKTTTVSAIHDLTITATSSSRDVGLFGYVGFKGNEEDIVNGLGSTPEAGETTYFEGCISTISNILLSDIKIISNNSLIGEIVDWLNGHKTTENTHVETHHIGILAGHVAYATIGNINIYYTAKDICAIKIDAEDGKSNYYSDTMIIGYLYCMNPSVIDRVGSEGSQTEGIFIQNNSGITSGQLGSETAGGGGQLSGVLTGYVLSDTIYNNYRYDSTGTEFTEETRNINSLYANEDNNLVALCKQTSRRQISIGGLGLGSTYTYNYFYDGVFTFVLSRGTVSDYIYRIWSEETLTSNPLRLSSTWSWGAISGGVSTTLAPINSISEIETGSQYVITYKDADNRLYMITYNPGQLDDFPLVEAINYQQSYTKTINDLDNYFPTAITPTEQSVFTFYDINRVKLTQMDENGQNIYEVSVNAGESLVLPNGPTVEGKIFIGWKRGVNNQLYATYVDGAIIEEVPSQYTYTFYNADGTTVETVTAQTNGTLQFPANLADNTNGRFVGWTKTGETAFTATYETTSPSYVISARDEAAFKATSAYNITKNSANTTVALSTTSSGNLQFSRNWLGTVTLALSTGTATNISVRDNSDATFSLYIVYDGLFTDYTLTLRANTSTSKLTYDSVSSNNSVSTNAGTSLQICKIVDVSTDVSLGEPIYGSSPTGEDTIELPANQYVLYANSEYNYSDSATPTVPETGYIGAYESSNSVNSNYGFTTLADALNSIEYKLMALGSADIPDYQKPGWTGEYLSWNDGTGKIITQIDNAFHINESTDGRFNLGTIYSSEAIANDIPIGSQGTLMNVPTAKIGFQVNKLTERDDNGVACARVNVILLASCTNSTDCLSFGVYEGTNSGDWSIYNEDNPVAAFALPTIVSNSDGSNYYNVTYNNTNYKLMVNDGDKVLVAHTFALYETGVYIMGATNGTMDICYFAVTGTSSLGFDGSGGSLLGTVDFVYDYNNEIVTVDKFGNTDTLANYNPSLILLTFNSRELTVEQFVNKEELYIYRYIDGTTKTIDVTYISPYFVITDYGNGSDTVINNGG